MSQQMFAKNTKMFKLGTWFKTYHQFAMYSGRRFWYFR